MMNTNSNREKLPRPLDGVRIVECGVWHAGPGADAILADLGAEVIKVESLDGDPERKQNNLGTIEFGVSEKEDWNLLFEISNRNKKGICIDIASAEGRKVLARLVETADIFLTNLRKTTIAKLAIDYESIKKINPKIIHVSVSGYGLEGPMATAGGFDPLGQAVSGMLFLTGPDKPVPLQTVILDQLTSITASHALLTALFVRERHGYGQALHVSLYGSALWLMHANVMTTSVTNRNVAFNWDRTANPPLRNNYKCKDGRWLMSCNHPEQKYWPTFCEVTGQQHLNSDPRFATVESRTKHAAVLVALLDEVFMTKTSAEWLTIFHANKLLFAPIQEVAEVLEDPQALINGYIQDVDHPVLGKVRIPGYPVQFSANETCTGPAPDRGQHTDAVLAGIGYNAAEISSLKQAGVIK